MTRIEMKHIHKVNEALKGSGYRIAIHNANLAIFPEDDTSPIVSTGSQDERRNSATKGTK